MKIHTKILILMFLFIFVLSGCGRQDIGKVSTDKKFDEGVLNGTSVYTLLGNIKF